MLCIQCCARRCSTSRRARARTTMRESETRGCSPLCLRPSLVPRLISPTRLYRHGFHFDSQGARRGRDTRARARAHLFGFLLSKLSWPPVMYSIRVRAPKAGCIVMARTRVEVRCLDRDKADFRYRLSILFYIFLLDV